MGGSINGKVRAGVLSLYPQKPVWGAVASFLPCRVQFNPAAGAFKPTNHPMLSAIYPAVSPGLFRVKGYFCLVKGGIALSATMYGPLRETLLGSAFLPAH